MSAPSSDEMYARLMAIHRDACTTRRYEVSYYVLSAMLHLAGEMGDKARLLEIAREATKRRDWLAVHELTHPLATRPSHAGAFEAVASMARARAEKGQSTHRGPNPEHGLKNE